METYVFLVVSFGGGIRAPTFRSRGDFAQNVTIPALKCCSKWLAGQKLKGFAFHTIENILKAIGLRNDSARVRTESGMQKTYKTLVMFHGFCSLKSASSVF